MRSCLLAPMLYKSCGRIVELRKIHHLLSTELVPIDWSCIVTLLSNNIGVASRCGQHGTVLYLNRGLRDLQYKLSVDRCHQFDARHAE